MAFGDVVQTKKVSLASGEAALTFDATGTLGNLLTVCEPRSAQHSAGGAWGAPANWNKLHDAGINVIGAGLTGTAYWKISDGTETGFGPTTHTNEQGNLQPVFVEFEGPFAASPLDAQAEDANNLASVVTSQSTGTGGTTAQADELWVAFFCADAFQNIDGSRAYTNSFVERVIGDVSAARATGIIASKVVSSTGAPECTFSCTDTGDEMYGQIATFKKAGGGGTAYQETGSAVAGDDSAGGDVGGGVDGGGDVLGWQGAGGDIGGLVDTGRAIMGLVSAGADVAGWIDGAAGVWGYVGAGSDSSAQSYTETGFATWGMVSVASDVLAGLEGGVAVVGAVGAGGDVEAMVEAGFGLFGFDASGDWSDIDDTPARYPVPVRQQVQRVGQADYATRQQTRKVR